MKCSFCSPVDLSDLARLHQHLLGPPIQTWISRSYFAFDGSLLSCQLPPSDGLTELTQELVRWRLAEFFDRARPGHGFRCRVLQTGGRPILMFKRQEHPDIPTGWREVVIDGQSYEANFVKLAVNVIRRPGQRANVLPELLLAMFGPHVGKPGTRFEVEFSGAPLEMKPVLA